MTIHTLRETLLERGIVLLLDGDELRYRAPKRALTDDLKSEIALHRSQIVADLKDRTAAIVPVNHETCGSCDVRYWVDEAPQDGRIRTTCGRCGRFIGYRPRNLAPKRRNPLEASPPA